MNKYDLKSPVFLGLSHIGQVYSISWAKKVGQCAVFDFDKKKLNDFKNQKYSNEEKNLDRIKFNKEKIVICKNLSDLKKYDTIFFTYDTPINNVGQPNLKSIENYIKKLISIKFIKKTKIIVTSQVYPGFMDKMKKKYLNNNMVELIYMVDTLKMGNAVDRFLNPEQLVFGCSSENKKFILKLFKKFKCKKYIFTLKEAELIKVSINLYLYFSVNFSNILDDYSKQIGVNFTNIIGSLKNDIRIGKHSYIHPSPSISGGHLERDVFYIKKHSKNLQTKKIFNDLQIFDQKKKVNLKNILLKLKKNEKIKLLIVGISYKENSFSMVNSMFKEILNDKRFSVVFFDSYFKKSSIRLNQVNKLSDSIDESDIVLFNYANSDDLQIIKKKFMKINNKYLVNISTKQKLFLKSSKNIINYFSHQVLPIC
jgi:nucleotide sugar dehydrogenase